MDSIVVEKQRAVARFNRLRRAAQLLQYLEAAAVLLGLVSWSSPRVVDAVRSTAAGIFTFSGYQFSHLVVFFIGNAIVVALFFMCRRDSVGGLSVAAVAAILGDFYQDGESDKPTFAEDEEKQMVVYKETVELDTAIRLATKRVEKFRRTESEKLKREMAVRPAEFRRSKTLQSRQRKESVWNGLNPGEIERLSSGEFREAIDAYIEKHWRRKTAEEEESESEADKNQMMMTAESWRSD